MVPTLTADFFPRYREGRTAKVVATDLLRKEFFSEDEGQYAELSAGMERSLSFDALMSEELIQLRSRLFSKLLKFYINYDRKIFMHMVRGRSYEAVALDGWWGLRVILSIWSRHHFAIELGILRRIFGRSRTSQITISSYLFILLPYPNSA